MKDCYFLSDRIPEFKGAALYSGSHSCRVNGRSFKRSTFWLVLVSIIITSGCFEDRSAKSDHPVPEMDEITKRLNEPYLVGAKNVVRAIDSDLAHYKGDNVETNLGSLPIASAVLVLASNGVSSHNLKFDPKSRLFLPHYLSEHYNVQVPNDWSFFYSWHYFNNTNEMTRILKYYYEKGVSAIGKGKDFGKRDEYVITQINENYVKSYLSVYFPDNVTVAEDHNRTIVRKGADAITIGNEIFPAVKSVYGHPIFCSIFFGKDKVFLAIYTEYAISYPLYCYAKKDNNLLWKAEVWADYPIIFPNYVSYAGLTHEIFFTEATNDIIIYGYDGSTYCEGFNKSDGKSVFRFSAIMWGRDDFEKEVIHYENPLMTWGKSKQDVAGGPGSLNLGGFATRGKSE